jgi:hypothetical protein
VTGVYTALCWPRGGIQLACPRCQRHAWWPQSESAKDCRYMLVPGRWGMSVYWVKGIADVTSEKP